MHNTFETASPQRPSLFLMHPTGASSRELTALESALSERFRVTRRDRPGWGAEPRLHGDQPAPYNARQGRWLGEQLRHELGPHVVFGWSSAGFIALHAALQHPGLIAALWLYEPPLWTSRDHDDRARLIEFARTLGWSALGQTRRANAAFWRMVSRRRDGTCGFARLPAARSTALCSERGPLARELLAGTGEELRESLPQLRVPVRVLVGDQSHPQSELAAQRLCRALPNAKCTQLVGLDHLAPLTDADALAEVIGATGARASAF